MQKRKNSIIFKDNLGKTYEVEFELYDGLSDFEIWQSLPGNSGKSRDQYDSSQRGEAGDYITKCVVTEKYV